MAKIAHLVDSSAYSGAEKIAIELIENDKNNEYFYICREGSIKKVLEDRNIRYIFYKNVFDLRKICRQENFDIIHCHDFKASLRGALVKAKHRIAHIHNNASTSKRVNIKTVLFLMLSTNMDKIVYVSSITKNEFIFKKLLKKKSTVISNWINKKERLCNDILDRDIDVLYIGRLRNEKNPKEVIRLVSSLKKEKADIKSYIIGDGYLEDEIRREVNLLGLEKNIIIKEFTDTPGFYMKKSKVLLVPSKWEGFGLVILEAMLNGSIVFGNEVGGIKNIIKDGKNGFFYNGDKSDKLVLDVINNYENYSSVIENSKETLEIFDMKKKTQEFYDLYNRILNR